MNDFPEMLSPKQAADFLGVGRDCIYKRLKYGQLPAVKIGTVWRIPKSELIAMARANMSPDRRRKPRE
jgi:excisionase family DNA binding protein